MKKLERKRLIFTLIIALGMLLASVSLDVPKNTKANSEIKFEFSLIVTGTDSTKISYQELESNMRDNQFEVGIYINSVGQSRMINGWSAAVSISDKNLISQSTNPTLKIPKLEHDDGWDKYETHLFHSNASALNSHVEFAWVGDASVSPFFKNDWEVPTTPTQFATFRFRLSENFTENDAFSIGLSFSNQGDYKAAQIRNSEDINYIGPNGEGVLSTPLVVGEILSEPSADIQSLIVAGQEVSVDNPENITIPSLAFEYTYKPLEEWIVPILSSDTATITELKRTRQDGVDRVISGDTVVIAVTDADGAVSKTYTIKFEDVLGPQLIIDELGKSYKSGIIMPPFNGLQNFYSITIPYGIDDTIKFKPTLKTAEYATITASLNSEEHPPFDYESGTTEYVFSDFSLGLHTIKLTVRLKDGFAGVTPTENVYTFNIEKQAPDTTATVSSLSLEGTHLGGSTVINRESESQPFVLQEQHTAFRFTVFYQESSVQSVLCEYFWDSKSGTQPLEKQGITGFKSKDIVLEKGKTYLVRLTATAQDGSVHIYEFEVFRPLSSDSTIGEQDISIQEGGMETILKPSGDRLSYTLKDSSVLEVNFVLKKVGENYRNTAIAEGGNIQIFFGENEFFNFRENNDDIAMLTVPSQVGAHQYIIVVTAADNVTTSTYILTITRQSSDATIKSIVVTIDGESVLTTADFSLSGGQYTHSTALEYERTKNKIITLSITSDETAKVTRNTALARSGFDGENYGPSIISSDFWVNFKFSANVIQYSVSVTAQDGTIESYTIVLKREAADNNATLSVLTANDITPQGFMSGAAGATYPKPIIVGGILDEDTQFNVSLNAEASSAFAQSVVIRYKAGTGSWQTLPQGTHSILADRGKNYEVEVTVTAQDGVSQQIYKFFFVVAESEDPDKEFINDIKLSERVGQEGTPKEINTFVFNPTQQNYTVEVASTTTHIMFVVTAKGKYTIISIGESTYTISPKTLTLELSAAGGEKTFTIKSKSEAGTDGKEYTITVKRKAYNNNVSFKTLSVQLTKTDGSTEHIDLTSDFESKTTHTVFIERLEYLANATITGTVDAETGSCFSGGNTLYQQNITLSGSTEISIIIRADNPDKIQTYKLTLNYFSSNTDFDAFILDGISYKMSDFLDSSGQKVLDLSASPIDFSITFYSVSLALKAGANSSVVFSPQLDDDKWIFNGTGQRQLKFTVTAEDGKTKTEYIVKVFRKEASSDAGLEYIRVIDDKGVDLLEGEQPTGTSVITYRIKVSRDTVIERIEFATRHSAAVAQATNFDVAAPIELISGGEKDFNITVTAQNGSKQHYVIKIIQQNSVGGLDDVVFEGMGYDFSEHIAGESVNLGEFAHDTTAITIIITKKDAYALSEVKNKNNVQLGVVNKGEATKTLSIALSSIVGNQFRIEVVSDDGSKKEVFYYTYTVKLPAADALLSSLTIKKGESEDLMQIAEGGPFESNKTSYVIYRDREGYESQTVRISAAAVNGGTYLIKLQSGQSSSSFADLKLSAGENLITIEVTAQNKIDTSTYTVIIYVYSDAAKITDIKVGQLSGFVFNPESENSTQDLGSFEYNQLDYGSIDITIDYLDIYSTLVIFEDGEKVAEIKDKTSYILSHQMKVGSHRLTFVVTSESGKTSNEFILTYNREPAKSYNKLDSLSAIAGESQLITGFNPDNNTYTVRVDRNVKKVNISADIDLSHRATVFGCGEYDIVYGQENKFTITVTAENGEENYYYIIIKVGNLDTKIIDISLADFDYDFNSHQGTYQLGEFYYSTNKIKITVTKNDEFARLFVKSGSEEKLIDSSGKTITFEIDLKVGSHEFEVFLRPDFLESSDSGESYVFSYTRKEVSKVASLSFLTAMFNGVDLLEDIFSPDVLLYDNIHINAYQNLGKDLTFSAKADHAGSVNVTSLTEPLQKGKREYNFVVTAEDGITKRTYTVIIYVYNDGNHLSSIAFDKAEISSESDSENGKHFVLSKVSADVSTIKLSFSQVEENIGAVVRRVIGEGSSGEKITSGAAFSLGFGHNTFTISVRSEYFEQIDNPVYYYYTFEIEREQPIIDTTLKELTIVSNGEVILGLPNPENPPIVQFSPDTVLYEFSLNRSYKMITINALPLDPNAFVAGCGDRFLVGGLNPIYINVTSQGQQRQYTILIYVANSEVEVKNITLPGFDLNFDKDVFEYNLTVSNATASINVEVDTTDNEFAKITGKGWHSLQEGLNNIVVTVSSEDGSQSYTYIIKIFREIGSGGGQIPKSSDATLYDLFIEDTKADYPLNFSQDKKSYSITLNPDDHLFYLGCVIDEKATVSGASKTYNIPPGDSRTITIQVTAEDGTKGEIYTLEITVLPLDTDNSLKELKAVELDGDLRTITLDHTLITQVLEVSPSTLNIKIIAVANSLNATVLGDGQYSLDGVETTITVIIQSQAGQPKSYTIIIKKVSSDNKLKELKVYDSSGNQLSFVGGAFSPDENEYRIDLTGTSISEITIFAECNCVYASASGTGTFILQSPEGQSSTVHFPITVRAQNGEIRTYKITVVRDLSPNDSVSVDLLRLTVDNKLYLSSDLSETPVMQFVMSTTSYDIYVPYASKSAYLNVVNNSGASVISSTGIHAKDLTKKTTTYIFKLKSKSTLFESDTYTINIILLAPDTDNTLKSLSVNGVQPSGFSSEKTEYEIIFDVAKVNLVLVEAKANSPLAVVSGGGEHLVSAGKNYIGITVTAEDGSLKTYTVVIWCQSFDAGISLIAVEGQEISPQFSPDVFSYTLDVEPFDKVVNIIVSTTCDKATVFGAGSKTLAAGKNIFTIYAVAESGSKGITYTLTINQRIPSSDTTLKSLVIKDLNGNQLKFSGPDGNELPFSPEQRSYIINLPEDTNISAVTVIAQVNDSGAKAFNTGSVYLEGFVDGKYHTVIKVPVMAEDGTVDEYIISIYRNVQLESLAEIYMITVLGSDAVEYLGSSNAKEQFLGSVTEYEIIVPYYVESITLLADGVGSVYGTATKFFGESLELVFSVYALAQDQATRSLTYKVAVIREQPKTINTLDSLTIDGIMVPEFSPQKFNYIITLPTKSGKNSVMIGATADECVVISGTGEFDLQPGVNMYTVIAKAQDQSINTYTITIYYVHSNALLSTLSVKGCVGEYSEEEAVDFFDAQTFAPDKFNYEILVDKNTCKLRITGTTADTESGARVSGFRTYDFPLDQESRVIEIEVVSADGLYSNIYCLSITRTAMLDKDSQLESLSIGGYTIHFSPDTYSYRLRVGSDTSKLDLSAKAFSANAKILIEGYQQGQPSNRVSLSLDDIETGKNSVLIRVEAEDGTVSYYRLSIIKDPKPDYLLTLLLILLVMLWIITIIFFIIKQAKLKLTRPRGSGTQI